MFYSLDLRTLEPKTPDPGPKTLELDLNFDFKDGVVVRVREGLHGVMASKMI